MCLSAEQTGRIFLGVASQTPAEMQIAAAANVFILRLKM